MLAAVPSISVLAADPAATETLPGQTSDAAVFSISRTGSMTSAVRVNYTLAGTATNGVDYGKLGTSVTIPRGQSSITVSIAPIDDTSREGDETVKLALAASSAYTIDPTRAAATATIRDNDVPDSKVSSIVSEVQQMNSTAAADSYLDFFTAIPVNQKAQRGYAQKTAQPDLLAARSSIVASLNAALAPAGGTVALQPFNVGGFAGTNIVGVLPGRGLHASERYLIAAHYDSVQNPGADDDASGVAGVLESACVLARHRLDATVVFVLFDQEEQRLNGWGVGSRFFADNAKATGMDLHGALVLDMIAYNNAGGNVAVAGQSDSSTTSASAAQANALAQAFRLYTGLAPRRMTGFDDTDAYRLYQDGFASVTLIEQLSATGDLLNPYYHQASDYYLSSAGQPQQYSGRNYLDFLYATQMTKGVVAWAAGQAQVLDGIAASVFAAVASANVRIPGTVASDLAQPVHSVAAASRPAQAAVEPKSMPQPASVVSSVPAAANSKLLQEAVESDSLPESVATQTANTRSRLNRVVLETLFAGL